MIAWDVLTATSVAPDGSTAWVHLINQAGSLIGGRSDLEIIASSEIVSLQADNDSLVIESDSSGVVLEANSKGITV